VDFRPHYKLGVIFSEQDFLRKFSKSCGNLAKFIPTIRGREILDLTEQVGENCPHYIGVRKI
jgi:hypothetical protein